MSEFNVKIVRNAIWYWYSPFIGKIFKVKRFTDNVLLVTEGPYKNYKIYSGDFELVEEEKQISTEFNLHTMPWYIRVNNKAECEAAQLWLFEQGIDWFDNKKLLRRVDTKFLTNVSCDKNVARLLWSDSEPPKGVEEIILTFKTVIASVEFPIVNSVVTEQQKQIKALEETIQKAAEQIALLKKS